MIGTVGGNRYGWLLNNELPIALDNVTRSDDASRAVTIGDVSVVEGNTGGSVAKFPVTLSHPSGVPVTVHFATARAPPRTRDGDFLSARHEQR